MMLGRRIRIWFHPRSRSSFCGIWIWDKNGGTARWGFILKAPWMLKLFSERYGKRTPILAFWGWRLFGPWRTQRVDHD